MHCFQSLNRGQGDAASVPGARGNPCASLLHALYAGAMVSTALWAGSASAAPEWSAWGPPEIAAGAGAGQPGSGCPIESRSGNLLYTASGSGGSLDIWVYERKGRKGAFDRRTLLGEPVSAPDTDDFCPTPLAGWWLMFVSNRDEQDQNCGEGTTDMYLAQYRPSPVKDFGSAINLGCAPDGPNTVGTELAPAPLTTSDGSFLYFSSDVGGNQDIYVSTQNPDGSYSEGVAVDALNTPDDDRQPNVSRDGLTIVFASDRDGGGPQIFQSTRESLDEPWGEPVNLTVSVLGIGGTRPSISWDMKRLYWGSAGTVYVSTRKPGGN